jgi:hypothetical protein
MLQSYGEYDLYDWAGLVPNAHGRSIFERGDGPNPSAGSAGAPPPSPGD